MNRVQHKYDQIFSDSTIYAVKNKKLKTKEKRKKEMDLGKPCKACL